MMDKYFYETNRETIEKIKDIDQKIHEENKKEKPNGSYLTKMMYEQLLTGLYLNNITNFNI